MVSNIVWGPKESQRTVIAVIETSNWKEGLPKDASMKKYLVWIRDKFIEKNGSCPKDEEFVVLANSLPLSDLKTLHEAFTFKEKHNKASIKNAETRRIENIFLKTLNERMMRGEKWNDDVPKVKQWLAHT